MISSAIAIPIKSRVIDLILIVFSVYLFNHYLVFENEVLFQDDVKMYDDAVNFTFPLWPEGSWPVLNPFNSFIFQIPLLELIQISPNISRAIILFFHMIPFSIIIYFIMIHIFHWNRTFSVSIAILPNILPNEVMIPYFINGSFVVVGNFFMTFGMYCLYCVCQKYHKRHLIWYKNGCFYFSVLSVYFAAISFEQSVFFIPALLIFALILISSGFDRKTIMVTTGIWILLLISKLIFILKNPRPTHGNGFLSIDEIIFRIINSTNIATPFPEIFQQFGNIVGIQIVNKHAFFFGVSIIVLGGGILILKIFKNKSLFDMNLLIYLFFLVFSVAQLFPFITMSPFNPSRYYYLSAFPLIGLCFYSVFILYESATINWPNIRQVKPAQYLFIFVMVILIISSGSSRISHAKHMWEHREKSFQFIKTNLSKFDFPLNSQLVVLGAIDVDTGGYYLWSTGYLKYALKRNDISGILPIEYNFYDPFNVNRKDYCWQMAGLDLNNPVFIYRANIHQKTWEQIIYGLKWEKSDVNASNLPHCIKMHQSYDQQSTWRLLQFDKVSGLDKIICEGVGYDEYLECINLKQIELFQVAWGSTANFESKQLYYQPNNYSDNITWMNGINVKTGDGFYIVIPEKERTPFDKGDLLKFNGAGEVEIKTVTRLDHKNNKYSSIFVTIDKKLDPKNDGFPQKFKKL